jgi:predicted nucleic acid-binding protein
VIPVKVVDSSAVAAILFDEPELGAVQALLRGSQVIAPSLLTYELANVCRTKCRQHPAERDSLVAGLALLPTFGILQVEVDTQAVLALALETRLTFYDASYLWLSRSRGAELVTLDKALARAASG